MNESLQTNATCRRIGSRIPLGFDVLWDHTDQHGHLAEGWDRAFEARGVNLSTGGLAMRVPFLPDVGERLACRITLPSPASRPQTIVAGTEVVWASSQGQRLGEVGLRFVDLPSEHESLLEALLRGRYRPPTPEAAMRKINEQISVDLDGVSDAIVASIVESDEAGITVEQPLPFLRIGAPAQLRTGDDVSRPVQLSAVDLVVEGDTPRLLLDLSYQDVSRKPAFGADRAELVPEESKVVRTHSLAHSTVHSTVHSTKPGIPAPDDSQAARILHGEPVAVSPDDTIPDAPDAPSTQPQYDQAYESEAYAEAAVYAEAAIYAEATGHEQAFFNEAAHHHGSAEAAHHHGSAEAEHHHGSAEAEHHHGFTEESSRVRQPSGLHALAASNFESPDEQPDYQDRDDAFEESLFALRRPNPLVEQAVARIKLWFSAVASLLMRYAKTVRRYALPRAQQLSKRYGTRAFEGVHRLGRTFSRLLPARTRRRTSQFPEARPLRNKKGQAEQSTARRRRWVGPAILLVGVLLALFALWPSDEAPMEEASSASGDAHQGEQLELSVADSFLEPLPEPPTESATDNALPELPELPSELMAEPAVSESSAFAKPASVEFGAAKVDAARTYRLRMSRPIERLEGRADAQGFVVRIPGSLSLDRAGPISASHPLVRRSMILNHGDYAELTIQFGDKGVPAYRVRGVGSELELLIGTKS